MSSQMIEMLENALRLAKEQGFTSLSLCVTSPNGNFYNYSDNEHAQQLELVSSLHDVLRAQVENFRPFDHDPKLGFDYACYHCAMVPNGFDFLTWLITQEMYRRDNEAPAPLKVAFWQGRVAPPMPNPWLNSVYRPLIKMIGAVEDDAAMRRLGADIHVTKAMTELYRAGAKLPPLRAIGEYDGLPKNVVTITLRENDVFPHRNSDLIEWYKFAKYLQDVHDERVVFVRDTSKADLSLGDCETFPLCARDLDARMYLYQNAKMNFFVSNGPMMLAVLSQSCPYIAFVPPEETDSKYDANKAVFWRLKMGVEIGEQFPWATQDQRIVWEQPNEMRMIDAYWSWRVDKAVQAA